MALDGTPILGESMVISVEDPVTPGTFLEIANMTRYSKNATRATKTTRVFNKTTPIRSVSKTREQSLSISGLESPNDAGQKVLNAAASAGTSVNIKMLVNGTDGYTQAALVRAYKNDASADDGDLREISYDLDFTGNATLSGTLYNLL